MCRTPNQEIADLLQHPGWSELQKLANQRVEDETLKLARTLLKGYDPLPPEDLAYRRGLIAGMTLIFKNPTLEANSLRKLLEQERAEQDG